MIEIDTNESYVSIKTAKMLKEAGFDWNTLYGYDLITYNTENRIAITCDDLTPVNHNKYSGLASRPTLYVAQRWLREVKGLVVQIDFLRNNKWWYLILQGERVDTLANPRVKHDTYEEALEEGIYECLLKLLKEKKDEETNFV